MEERRKNRRMGLEGKLLVNRIDGGAAEEVHIDMQDVSKTGVGFISEEKLEENAIYEAYITLWTKDVIHSLIKIVRIQEQEECFLYGAIFIGLSDVDAFRISVYDTLEQEEHKNDVPNDN